MMCFDNEISSVMLLWEDVNKEREHFQTLSIVFAWTYTQGGWVSSGVKLRLSLLIIRLRANNYTGLEKGSLNTDLLHRYRTSSQSVFDSFAGTNNIHLKAPVGERIEMLLFQGCPTNCAVQ